MDSEDTDTLRYTAIGNAVSVPVVEWIAQRVHTELLTDRPLLSRDDLQSYVPEFSKTAWSPLHLSEIDFSDESSSYKWPKAGLAWDDSFIGSAVSPTPAKPIPSSLLDIVERERVGERYYLTSNAAEGIIRRVDNQGRKLFPPLRKALEAEKSKKDAGGI